MTRIALALSPHLDDAVFSCGGTLALLVRHGWRVVVATVFTRSMPDPQGFALACQLDKGLGAQVDYMALRRAEDRTAMASLGIEAPIHIALPEAPHRGYGSAEALFEAPLTCDGIGAELATVLAAQVESLSPDLILAPQAVGGHVDHVQLVRALRISQPVLWWRDFPYLAREAAPPEPFRERFDALPEYSVAIDAGARTAKEAACLAYASQLGFQFGGPEGLRRKLRDAGAAERFRGTCPSELTASATG